MLEEEVGPSLLSPLLFGEACPVPCLVLLRLLAVLPQVKAASGAGGILHPLFSKYVPEAQVSEV